MFSKDRNFIFYAGLEQDEIFFQWPGQTWSDDSYSPFMRHWYQNTKEADDDRIQFIEPYADFSRGFLTYTSSAKITQNG